MLLNSLADCSSSGPPASSPPLPKARDLKLDVPLTPSMTVPQPKSVSFSDIVEKIPLMATGHDRTASDDDYEAFFNEVVEPSAMQVQHELQHEKLQEADSTKRVRVPSLDSTIPEPPWKLALYDKDDGLDIQSLMLPVARMTLHRWPGTKKIDTAVHWAPFPTQLAKIAIQERLGDESAVAQLVESAQYTGTVDTNSLTWKPEGFRMLGFHDEDDEEIGFAKFGSETELDALVKKRKSEFGQDTAHVATPSVQSCLDSNQVKQSDAAVDTFALSLQSVDEQQRTAQPVHEAGGQLRVTSDLTRFMSVQGHESKRPKLDDMSAGNPSPQKPKTIPSRTNTGRNGENLTEAQLQTQMPLPCLWDGQPVEPRPFIASSAMLAQLNIIRQITKFCPSLELVERDWVARSRRQNQTRHNPTRFSPSDYDEGDFILSPGLGVICTTLQKIKQMPLPQQGNKSFIKQRVELVAPRHERLVVLVAKISSMTVAEGLEERDSQTLVDLIAFTASIEDDVSIQLLGGGDEDLSRWIIGLMASSPCPKTSSGEGMKLLQDETLVSNTVCQWASFC